MRAQTRSQRQEEIEIAAYKLLEKSGYAGTSMQGIARMAKASNETLYNWYGDKQGLFKALVTRNAAEVKALLEQELSTERNALAILGQLGPKLLGLLLGERAIALNRAAAADASGELGAALGEAGRDAVLPLLLKVLERAQSAGQLSFERSDQAAILYLNLLVGDLQIRRVIGTVPPPTAAFCEERSQRALSYLSQIMG
ncbi:TetR/AcrR family transcriptional regulator [Devosia rhodophyticola]|uniref:TetR/AcrR family transcriptional regulator n=1 Tax=Devosia rhodophyticola TaxID=3026423 RepID=A0ABY7YXS7_9HYPH|nr:TetR/AcrR family transcriptional regulator [Devosia rhodophyticola]WDR06049.1 TetR/AcrR family transcriptional regulator [Devosia rhodophyticola]